jgi:predicted RNase H-like HicB family nuclease
MKTIEDYLSLNYHKRLYQDEGGDWIVAIDDLEGCVADGKTPDEAVANLREAMRSWLESRIQAGLEIPEPSGITDYSGRVLLRMPRSLHQRLSIQAKAEGVSLNQYLVSLLAYSSGRSRPLEQGIIQAVSTNRSCSLAGTTGEWYWANAPSEEPVRYGNCLVGRGVRLYPQQAFVLQWSANEETWPHFDQSPPRLLPAPQNQRGTA